MDNSLQVSIIEQGEHSAKQACQAVSTETPDSSHIEDFASALSGALEMFNDDSRTRFWYLAATMVNLGHPIPYDSAGEEDEALDAATAALFDAACALMKLMDRTAKE